MPLRSISTACCHRPGALSARWMQPAQQHGRFFPSTSSSRVRSIRRRRVASCLASSTQQMNSFRQEASSLPTTPAPRDAIATRLQDRLGLDARYHDENGHPQSLPTLPHKLIANGNRAMCSKHDVRPIGCLLLSGETQKRPLKCSGLFSTFGRLFIPVLEPFGRSAKRPPRSSWAGLRTVESGRRIAPPHY